MNPQDKLRIEAELARRLTEAGLLSATEVDEAREAAEISGEALESALFRLGFLSEADLVLILGAISGYPTVTLSGRDLAEELAQSVTAILSRRHRVIPLEYDPEAKTILVAAVEPGDNLMRQALAKALPEYRIDCYQALEPTLRAAQVRLYRGNAVDTPPLESVRTEACLVCLESEIDQKSVAYAPEELSETDGEDNQHCCRMLVLSGSPLGEGTLGRLLAHQGYRLNWTEAAEIFVRSYHEVPPDLILLLGGPGLVPLLATVHHLQEEGIDFGEQPSFLISSDLAAGEAGRLLEAGFEDIIPVENILDMLMIKLARVLDRITREEKRELDLMHDLGTRGTLEDMNVIDLVQSMGNSRKTVRMSISAAGSQLTIFFDRGRVSFAECDDLTGADAIYAALGWKAGIWNVDPVSREELPEPNNLLTNEAILLEGCRRLDECEPDSAEPEPVAESDPGNLTAKLDILFDQF